MTQITPREFYDDLDNEYQIRMTIRRKRYIKPFKYLYRHFFENSSKWVTGRMFQEALCIVDRQEAYQILSSLCILNMLEKERRPRLNAIYYKPLHEHWWKKFAKEKK